MDSEQHNPITRTHDGEEEDHHINHPQNLSRLSMCTSSANMDSDRPSAYNGSDDERGEMVNNSEDGDADEEFSLGSSDSDKEQVFHLSLPTTPRKGSNTTQPISISNKSNVGAKEHASENEVRRQRRLRQRKSFPSSQRKSFGRDKWENTKEESEFTVMTRPKGSRRSLCMDLDEVKACRDLGFELELPTRLAISCSCSAVEANDTSSGGNSPISNWRISSPGEDPYSHCND